MGSPAPGLLPEMTRAKSLAWARMGCCPNSKHSYGFHMPTPGAGDYSLDAGRNKSLGAFCCAVDIGTTSADARRYVKAMFDRWDAGAQPVDQAELIGSPDGRKVLYASWKNPGRVELYRGAGHDTWCHSSKFRSLARADGRWFDPAGPFLGPVLRNTTEEDALMAVTDAEWAEAMKKIGRLNSQIDRLDAIISGKTAFPGSNLQEQFAAVNKRLDALGKTLAAAAAKPAGT
jgi:hypothetical protein